MLGDRTAGAAAVTAPLGKVGALDDRIRWLEAHAATAIAVSERRGSLTYGDLQPQLERVHHTLGDVSPGRVLALLPDTTASYLLHLYCFVQGATIIPQSPMLSVHRLTQLLELIRPELVVTSGALLPKYRSVDFGCPVLLAEDGPDVLSTTWTYDGAPSSTPSSQPEVRALLFTSGSTGGPKGVCLSERSITAAAAMNMEMLSLSPGRRSMITVPFFDYYGLIQIHSHVLAGAEIVIGESVAFTVPLIRRAQEAAITDLVGVPYGLRRIFLSADGGAGPLSSLRVIASSSETLTPDVQTMIFSCCPGAEIIDVYGLTEAGRACSRTLREPVSGEFLGRPAAGVRFAGGTPQRPEELVIGGPNVMLGYMTGIAGDGTIAYEPSALVRTGDLGYVETTGDVHILGRSDDLLNIRGTKIHPAEIESVAHEVIGVADARARLLPGPEPEIVLEVQTRPDADIAELRKMLRERLPSQFVPSRIDRVTKVERTALGSKVLRG